MPNKMVVREEKEPGDIYASEYERRYVHACDTIKPSPAKLSNTFFPVRAYVHMFHIVDKLSFPRKLYTSFYF